MTLPSSIPPAAGIADVLRELWDALEFDRSGDAYHNLGGALIDMSRDGHADKVTRNTVRRVEAQLAKAKTILERAIALAAQEESPT